MWDGALLYLNCNKIYLILCNYYNDNLNNLFIDKGLEQY